MGHPRQILVLLLAFAVVIGAMSGFARATQYNPKMIMDSMPCSGLMSPSAFGDVQPLAHGKDMAPCKGMTPGCMKLMGCATISGLPVGISTHTFAVQYGVIDYPAFLLKLDGLVHRPEPFPPKSA